MERNEILEKIIEIASDVLGTNPDDVNEQTTFDDLDADSLDRLQLVTAMEDESTWRSMRRSFSPQFRCRCCRGDRIRPEA